MKLSTFGPPSPALMIALVALCLAVGGTAVAGTAGITAKLDRIEKKQVKKLAKKQANKAITKRAPGLAVASAQNAASATSAETLNGLRVVPISHRSPAGTTGVTILDAGGLRLLLVSCAAGQEELHATTTVAGGEITAISDDAGGTDGTATSISHQADSDFGPGDDFDLTEAIPAVDDRIYQLHYTGGDGQGVSASLATESDIGASDCVVTGYAVVG